MIDICKIFVDEYKRQPLHNVYLDGQMLKWSDNIVHLGNHLKYHISDDTDVNKKKGDFISSVNRLVAKFGFVQSEVLNKLFF